MENLEALLERWRATEAEHVATKDVKRDPALQPRADDLVPFKDRSRHEETSQAHVDRLRDRLAVRNDCELDPVLAARVGGRLLLVDGHHRHDAYRRAGRHLIPARILDVPMAIAVAASKLVNVGGEQLPLHPEQARDAAWQYLAAVTDRGRLPLPDGDTCRTVAARFGTGRDTVSRMLRRLPTVDLAEFVPDACCPCTGWPRWKYLKSNGVWKDRDALVPADERMRRNGERVAVALGRLMDKHGSEAFALGVSLLRLERSEMDAEAVDHLASLAQGGDDGDDY